MERGYQFRRNDLYMETWTDLIVLENAIAKAVSKKNKPKPMPSTSAPKTPKPRGKK